MNRLNTPSEMLADITASIERVAKAHGLSDEQTARMLDHAMAWVGLPIEPVNTCKANLSDQTTENRD